jgi:catechol 2,3-dioxygenase-like lactoylglutathione lyase family enzyme
MISLEKAKEFYIGFLGFQIDREARYHDISAPVTGIDELQAKLVAKKYKYMNPGIEDTPWGTRDMAVVDPVGNTIIFTEDKPAAV